jgi:hypothetical protein
MDRAGFTYGKVPSALQSFLDNSAFEYESGGPRIVAFGPGQSFLIVLKNGDYAYDLRDSSVQLDQTFDRFCGGQMNALDGLVYFSMSCYAPGLHSGFFRDPDSQFVQTFGEIPEGWREVMEGLTEPFATSGTRPRSASTPSVPSTKTAVGTRSASISDIPWTKTAADIHRAAPESQTAKAPPVSNQNCMACYHCGNG